MLNTQKGFSLVELMVGLVIGLLATLVILQMFALFEGQKRTTTGSSDAQENGLVALLTMERDIRMAGVGIADSSILSCSTLQTYYNNNSGSSGPITSLGSSFAPIKITDGGTGADKITMLFGTSFSAGANATITVPMPNPSADLNVSSTTGFAAPDLVIVSDGSTCTLMQISNVQSNLKILHNFSNSGPNYNCNAACMAAQTPPWTNSYPVGAKLFDIGSIVQRTYSVAAAVAAPTSVLQLLEFMGTSATPIVSDIVNIQAQYGIAPSGSQQVNCWVNATNGGNACDATDWSAPSATNIKRIKAVHIAVVARSALSEKPSSGTTCDATTTAPTSWTGGPTIDLSSDANWKCYRYKVYQTIVPLRNIIWANL